MMKHVKRIFIVIISVVICATSPHNAVTYAAPTSTLNHNDQGIVWFDNATCSSTGSVELAGDTNIEKILNFFMSKGLSIAQASGFVGNMVQESGNGLDEKVEPKVKNPTPNLEQGVHWSMKNINQKWNWLRPCSMDMDCSTKTSCR